MFKELNRLRQSELRLAVMSLLISVEEADFVYIRQQTKATAGQKKTRAFHVCSSILKSR